MQEHSVLSFYIRRVLFMALWKVSHYCGGTKARSAQSETFRYTYLLIEKGQTGTGTHTATAWKQKSRFEHTYGTQATKSNNTKRDCTVLCRSVYIEAVFLGSTVMLFLWCMFGWDLKLHQVLHIHQLCTNKSNPTPSLNSLGHLRHIVETLSPQQYPWEMANISNVYIMFTVCQ